MEQPDFEKCGGLVPAIAQDEATGEVLMLAYMNEEAWNETLRTGEVHYYSRSRKTLWHKGGTSGHAEGALHSPGLRPGHRAGPGRADRRGGLPHRPQKLFFS